MQLDVKPGGGMLAVSISTNNVAKAQETELGAGFDIVFNPTGTHYYEYEYDSFIEKYIGKLKIRLDFYPHEGTKAYEQQYIYYPIEPIPPYPGKVDEFGNPVDQKEYDAWWDSLPREWRLNPALCLFVKVDSTTTITDLETYLSTTFTPEMMATIDDVIVLEDSAHLISPLLRDKNIIDEAYSVGDKETIIDDTNVKFADFAVSGDESGISQLIQPQSIDIGPGASVDRNSTIGTGSTVLDDANPANDTGTIDTWELWFNATGSNVDVATFIDEGSNVYSTRDTELIGTVTGGSKQTFSGKSTSVGTGDYAGLYWTSGAIETSTSGGIGIHYKSGDHVPCSSQTFTSLASYQISIYGTGTEAGGDPEISVLPISYDFGVVAESTEPYTATDYFTITNNSTMQTDQTISVTSSTWTGGNAFTHSDTATPGADTVGLLSNRGGTWGVSDVIVKFSSPNYIYENCPATTSYDFGIKLLSPTSASDGAEKTNTVRITATAD